MSLLGFEQLRSKCMNIIQVLIDAIMRHRLLTYWTGNSHAFLRVFITITSVSRTTLTTRRPLLPTNPPINLIFLPPSPLQPTQPLNLLLNHLRLSSLPKRTPTSLNMPSPPRIALPRSPIHQPLHKTKERSPPFARSITLPHMRAIATYLVSTVMGLLGTRRIEIGAIARSGTGSTLHLVSLSLQQKPLNRFLYLLELVCVDFWGGPVDSCAFIVAGRVGGVSHAVTGRATAVRTDTSIVAVVCAGVKKSAAAWVPQTH
jgi:hypothetical protein